MDSRFAHVARLDLRPRQLPLPGIDPPVRPDRRAHGRLYPAAARLRPGRGAAGAEGHFHEHGTTLAGLMAASWRRPARFPRRRPRHRARPRSRPTRGSPRPGAAARPQDRLHQRRRALCPARARGDRRSATISPASTTFTPASFGPSPTPTAIDLLSSASRSTRARAVMVEDMAQNLARESARHDHGMGRQWLRTRQSRPSPRHVDHTHRRCRRMARR